jgi:hypothetical protein
MDIPQERIGPVKDLPKDLSNWPDRGNIIFNKISLRYRP